MSEEITLEDIRAAVRVILASDEPRDGLVLVDPRESWPHLYRTPTKEAGK